MARIPYVDPDKLEGKTRELMDKLQRKNLFLMLAHSPSHFETYVRMGAAIRAKGELDAQLRELAITRTGILCSAPYEIIAHERLARGAGVTEEKIEALREGPEAAAFTDLEKAVLRYTDDLVANDRASDATFEPLRKQLTPGAMIELNLAVGFYIMTSKFLETFGVDLQKD